MDSLELQEKTKQFAIKIYFICKELPGEFGFLQYRNQLVRSSSSVGANYRAACRAKSLKDFINKLKIVEEELDESIFFLELLVEIGKEKIELEKIRKTIVEANELLAIIVASLKTSRSRLNNKKY